MDIIKTNIINLLSKLVKNKTFNSSYLYGTIKLKKNFFILIFAVSFSFLMFIETMFFLLVQSKKQVKNNITKSLNLKSILKKIDFLTGVSFLLSPKMKEYEKISN